MDYKKFIYFQLIMLSICGSCIAQVNETSLIKIDSNEKLKYALTYLQASEIKFQADDKHHFFIKTFKIRADSFILLNHEERIQKEYFYFLVSSIDEATHLEARLLKTHDLINPVINKITESKDGDFFLVHILSFKPEKKERNIDQSNSMKSNHLLHNELLIFKVKKY